MWTTCTVPDIENSREKETSPERERVREREREREKDYKVQKKSTGCRALKYIKRMHSRKKVI